jgi:DNA-binding NtrC family response regulator
MTTRSILVMTDDVALEAQVAAIVADGITEVRMARNVDAALQIVCEHGQGLDLAVIDFEEGCHGMTLFTALHVCQPDLRIISIIAGNDVYQSAAIAYANGVAACLAKPANEADLRMVIEKLNQPKLQLAA